MLQKTQVLRLLDSLRSVRSSWPWGGTGIGPLPPSSRDATSRRGNSQLCKKLLCVRAFAPIPRAGAEWLRLRTGEWKQAGWSPLGLEMDPAFICLTSTVPVSQPLLAL